MSQLGVILQEAVRREREARTIMGFLRAKMEGIERETRRRNLKERLGFKGMGCCGATWSRRAAAISAREDDDDELQPTAIAITGQAPDPDLSLTPAPSSTNLAAALAAERRLRAAAQEMDLDSDWVKVVEEWDGGEKELKGGEGGDWVCCVCTGRKKGAAFIPCGHTYCRVCSRELWLNRGSCPLCNCPIVEILDIF